MNVTRVACPKCGEAISFEVLSDYQGDGPMGCVVTTIELVEKQCKCELSVFDFEELEERADQRANEDPYIDDFDPDVLQWENDGGRV